VTKGATPQNEYHIRQGVEKGANPQKTPFRHSVAKGATPQNEYHIRQGVEKGANRSLHIVLILAKGVKFQNAYILC